MPAPETTPKPPTPRTARQWIRLGLSVVLLAATVVYIGHLLHGQSTNFRAIFASLSGGRILFGLAMATITLVCPTLYHALAVERLAPVRGARLHIAAGFALSQIVRYVPGKVLGVLFEVNYLRATVTADTLLLANTSQMLYQYASTAAGAIPLAAVVFSGSQWFWGLAAVAGAIFFIAHRFGWCEHALIWTARRIPGLHRTITASVNSRHAAYAAPMLLGLEWVFLIAVWYAIDLGTTDLGPYVFLAICYAGASVLGSLAVLMPSGLVIREGLFVWMVHSNHSLRVDPVALLVYAAMMRVWFTGADILVAAMFGLADRLRGRKADA